MDEGRIFRRRMWLSFPLHRLSKASLPLTPALYELPRLLPATASSAQREDLNQRQGLRLAFRSQKKDANGIESKRRDIDATTSLPRDAHTMFREKRNTEMMALDL